MSHIGGPVEYCLDPTGERRPVSPGDTRYDLEVGSFLHRGERGSTIEVRVFPRETKGTGVGTS